ncbi:MAG: Arginine/ornithine antiporter ArcD [Phycisphaerales bacterium]|nr:Arginine/ornithine antiporter ArcD [Phycisphaerales bacterium]
MLEYDDHRTAQPHARGPRPSRKVFTLFAILAMLVIGSLAAVVVRFTRSSGVGRIGNPPGMVDHLDFFETSTAFAAGRSERVEWTTSGHTGVILKDPRGKFPRDGSWLSPEVATPYDFTELIPSYNPKCPPDTGLRFDVRARDARTGQWSPWFFLGAWGKTIGKEERLIEHAFGKVDIDTLILARPADAYQVSVHFYAFGLDDNANPSLRRLAVSYSGVVYDASRRAQLVTPVSMDTDFARDIPVPFRAQGNAAKPLRPEICSPTSVSMVMQYLGHDRPTEENALAIYDIEYDMFGNWGRAVAWAGENGFDAWLTRFRTWDQVKATIATGQPIIASIRFKKGECPSFVIDHTAGHLIVIRGVTKGGDLIVNDPASRLHGNGAVYKADEMAKAWIAHGGVGYIIRKPRT